MLGRGSQSRAGQPAFLAKSASYSMRRFGPGNFDLIIIDEAVADGFLVPPFGVSVGTKFLRQGIR